MKLILYSFFEFEGRWMHMCVVTIHKLFAHLEEYCYDDDLPDVTTHQFLLNFLYTIGLIRENLMRRSKDS